MNPQWVRSNLSFRIPYVCYSITLRDAEGFKLCDDADECEEAAMKMIEHFRPEMKGGMLLGMEFAFVDRSWRFMYAHPSLPKTQLGGYAPEVPLIPKESR